MGGVLDNRRWRREAGVTYLNIRRTAKKLKEEDPEGWEAMANAEQAVVILADISEDGKAEHFQGLSDIDWGQILEFIIKILPLILIFI